MSQYSPELRTKDKDAQAGREGINGWPSVGTWEETKDFNHLKSFGEALHVPKSTAGADLLNSIPTPWARLLLFESALNDEKHPAHDEITKQWRGLLGVLALADCLGLDVRATPLALGGEGQPEIIKAFRDLRPKESVREADETLTEKKNEAQWNSFYLISVDNIPLGSTSPRTLVFTGVAHACPASIPFRSAEGRLSDPVSHFKEIRDANTLTWLSEWISELQKKFQPTSRSDTRASAPVPAEDLVAWFGIIPGTDHGDDKKRSSLLALRLGEWLAVAREALASVKTASVEVKAAAWDEPLIKDFPYKLINRIKPSGEHQSDLLLKDKKLLDGFRRTSGSDIVDNNNQPIRGTLRVWDHRTMDLSQLDGEIPFPSPLQLGDYKVIKDPRAKLFEDTLIQVNLPQNPRWAYELRFGNNTFLFPFKKRIFDLLSNKEIFENTTLTNLSSSAARVELKIPLASGKRIRVNKDFIKTDIITERTPEIAVWPDFTHDSWHQYYYFIARAAERQVELKPLDELSARGTEHDTWYSATKPVTAFIGSIDGKSGLLLLKRQELTGEPSKAPVKRWKVGIDFGSTHTRAFYVEMPGGQQDEATEKEKIETYDHKKIMPVEFETLSQPVTSCTPDLLQQKFMALDGQLDPPARPELKTLMMKPELNPGSPCPQDWLPREGYVYSHWLYEGNYDSDRLRHELKWSAAANEDELYAFLYCLVTMIEAEAFKKGARIASVRFGYPSVLTPKLIEAQKTQWNAVAQKTNVNVQTEGEDGPLTEAVAVCNYLTFAGISTTSLNVTCLDVGGSTTDIAIWAGSELKFQESVKLASDVVGRFVQSEGGLPFRQWLVRTLRGHYYGPVQINLDQFVNKPSGYSLMFSNILTYLESRKTLEQLKRSIRAADEGQGVVATITFLFSSLLYYAGILARRSGLAETTEPGQQKLPIYFCGKGGTLIGWLEAEHYKELAFDMFTAGLGQRNVQVEVTLSSQPKEEVGRGLLAISGLKDARRRDKNRPFPVTAGESGYKYKNDGGQIVGLEWHQELDEDMVRNLVEVPAPESLGELNNFIEKFRESSATRDYAKFFGMSSGLPQQMWSRLHGRFFNKVGGSIVYDAKQNKTLLEPFFVTEVKVLAGFLNPPLNL